MSANHLWTPMRVKNFMRELKMKATKWDENIVALAEKGSMSVEEFLKTDPITFGEKMWGKHDWKYTSGYSRLEKILGESTHREMWGYYVNTPAQLAAREAADALFARRREAGAAAAAAAAQLAALNEAEKAAGVCQDGWHGAALEHANALFKLKEADTALAEAAAAAAASAASRAAATRAAQKEWDERYAAAVEEDERYFAGRTFDQVVADEEEAAAEKRAQAVAEVKNHIVFNPEDEEDEDEEDEDEDEEDEDEEVKSSEWTCQTCSAVWRTKTKTD